MVAALDCLASLPALATLVLKDVTNTELETVLARCGERYTDIRDTYLTFYLNLNMSRLRRLELHYLVSGVDLCLISSFAPALLHLTVCDSKVFCSDPALLGGGGGTASTLLGGGGVAATTARALLPRLLSCHLLRVSYEGGAEAALLGHAPALSRLHQEAGPAITDELVQRLVAEGRLDHLGIG